MDREISSELMLSQYILNRCMKESNTNRKHFSIIMTWQDQRYIEKERNLHRLTECPSNHVPYDDTYNLWEPQPKVRHALELVIFFRNFMI